MILHITNDYSGSTVYKNLVGELDNLGLPQIVYNPIKEKCRIGKNKIDLNVIGSEIIYSHILNKTTDRLFYKQKIKKILKDIESKVDLTKVRFIHAHTWYSDGGVVYLLSKKYNIPYIVTIRNSDLNVFQKYLVHERSFGCKVLENAKNVILIAASYKQRILSEPSLQKIKEPLEMKLKVIPNGVDTFWIDKAENKLPEQKIAFKFLYIGKFDSGKNVVNLVNAIKNINKDKKFCTLDLVGGSGADEPKILKQVKGYPEIFKYHGKVYNKEKLKEIFQSCDIFAMPSRNETFGLVYVEAMLQGLPILYTDKEGVDGFYEERIGEKVRKQADSLEIKQALLKMMENYSNYKIPTEKLMENHNWKNIALTYQNLYIIKQ